MMGMHVEQTGGSHDADHYGAGDHDADHYGAGDHDATYAFGQHPHVATPAPFTARQFGRLLVVRGRIRALAEFALELQRLGGAC